jgi:hypothetical protein
MGMPVSSEDIKNPEETGIPAFETMAVNRNFLNLFGSSSNIKAFHRELTRYLQVLKTFMFRRCPFLNLK